MQLGDHATDDVHRIMFETVAGGLVAAAVEVDSGAPEHRMLELLARWIDAEVLRR